MELRNDKKPIQFTVQPEEEEKSIHHTPNSFFFLLLLPPYFPQASLKLY
jgi:hypothetical protein